ncbi:MAG: hypothetical protein ACSNEK_00870 [Parachlamydiaceae bacterium]
MFEVTATHATLIYLGGTVAIIFAIWIFHHYEARKRPWIGHSEELYICEYCHFAYLSSHHPINRCPQCKSFNKDNRHQP